MLAVFFVSPEFALPGNWECFYTLPSATPLNSFQQNSLRIQSKTHFKNFAMKNTPKINGSLQKYAYLRLSVTASY
jgi:hypothetical protein